MAGWSFEPGHTAAHFRARHMMVSWVRGHFGDVHGTLDFDPDEPEKSKVEVDIDAAKICTGEEARDEHLRSADFLDTDNHPKITFRGTEVEVIGENEFIVTGELTLRGVTNTVALDCRYHGSWKTPWWAGDPESGFTDKGPVTRAGFTAHTRIARFDYGVNWQDKVDRAGVVVGRELRITIEVEVVLDSDLERIGEK